MTTISNNTENESANTFSISSHIDSRAKRHEIADISNKDLLGLSTIELNVSELCNRKCSFCPRYDEDIYPNQKLFMATTTVRNLVKQLESASWHGDIHITGFGEPHTHPELLEIVSILNTYPKLFIEITSNGDRLIDKEMTYTQKLFNNGLNMLTIDCYDGDEQYNKRTEIMTILPTDKYRLRAHYDIGNTDELMVEYGFNNRSGIMGGEGIQNKCYLPFYKTLIDWNGDLILCCNDWHRQAGNMGNINENGIVDSWNSDKIQNIRRRLAQGKREGVCANCNINGTKFGLNSFLLHNN